MNSRSILRSSSREAGSAAVAETLRDRIRGGAYGAGEMLPSERVLAGELKVHRRAIRTAIAQLADEGLILQRANCRPIVREPSAGAAAVSRRKAADTAPSRLVALVMWRGGTFERGATAQQRIFWGMNQALAHAGYHGLFVDLGEEIGSDEENAAREAARLRYSIDHGFAGVIFYAYAYNRNRELIQEVARRIPLVLIDRMVPGVDADFVGVDNAAAMYEATVHLIRQGHSRLAYVTRGEPIHTVQDRVRGYLRALHEHLGDDVPEIVLTATVSGTGSWPVFDTLFRLPCEERPTAILCVNDFEAVRIVERLMVLGLSVPQDVAVVGFDNIVHLLPNGIGLSTVAQPFEEIGRVAAEVFLKRKGEPARRSEFVQLPAHLVVRESSAPQQGAIREGPALQPDRDTQPESVAMSYAS